MKNNQWLPGRVLDKFDFRKYLVVDEKGQQLIHLKETNNTLTNHLDKSMLDNNLSLPSETEMQQQLDNTDSHSSSSSLIRAQ